MSADEVLWEVFVLGYLYMLMFPGPERRAGEIGGFYPGRVYWVSHGCLFFLLSLSLSEGGWIV